MEEWLALSWSPDNESSGKENKRPQDVFMDDVDGVKVAKTSDSRHSLGLQGQGLHDAQELLSIPSSIVPAASPSCPRPSTQADADVVEPGPGGPTSWVVKLRSIFEGFLGKRGEQVRPVHLQTGCSGIGTASKALQDRSCAFESWSHSLFGTMHA